MKKISKTILLCTTVFVTVFVISACGKKEPTTADVADNTEEEASTEEEVATDESGVIIRGCDPLKIPKPTQLILTVNGEDVYYIEDEKEIKKITDMLRRNRYGEETIKFGAEESVNWMYELDINNGRKLKINFSEDGKYETWYGDVYNASTGIVEHLKSIIHAQKKKNEIQWGKISKIILVCIICIIVLIAVFAIRAHRKKKLTALKKNTEEEVSADGK